MIDLREDDIQAMADKWHGQESGTDLDRMRAVAEDLLETLVSHVRCPDCRGFGIKPVWRGEWDGDPCDTCNARGRLWRERPTPPRIIPPLPGRGR